MTEPDPQLLNLAAHCCERIGMVAEAARCYRDAGAHRRAADLFTRLGLSREAGARPLRHRIVRV